MNACANYDCPSYTEIAVRLSLPIGSIGPMRMRALRLLRRTPEFSDAEARLEAARGRASFHVSSPEEDVDLALNALIG